MTIRGGGNPYMAMAAMPLGELTRRLGALPAEAYDCFMVGTLYGFNRIQAWFARDCPWPMAGSPRIIAYKPFGGAEEAPSLTVTVRDGDGNMRSGRKNARGAGQKCRNAPLTKKAPYKPYAGKPHVRFCAGGAMKIASLVRCGLLSK